MKKFRYTILILFLLILFYFINSISPIFFRSSFGSPKRSKDFRITGHRGAAGLAPENSLEAVRVALKSGVDRIEIDVHQTKDNQIVVIHDFSVDRTTNGKGQIKDLTLEQIKSFNIKNPDNSVSDLKIPTLGEVIETIGDSSILLIEVKKEKELYPGIEQRIVDIILSHHASGRCIIQSFNDEVLSQVHAIEPGLELHKLFVAKLPLFSIIFDGKLKCKKLKSYDYVSEFSVYYPFVTRALIKKVHKLNKKINVWTVDDTIKMKKLIDIGVDGIITNYPDKLKNQLK